MKNRKMSFKLIKTNPHNKHFQVSYYGFKGELILWKDDYEDLGTELNACWEDYNDFLFDILMYQFDHYLDWIYEYWEEINEVYDEKRKQIIIEIPEFLK